MLWTVTMLCCPARQETEVKEHTWSTDTARTTSNTNRQTHSQYLVYLKRKPFLSVTEFCKITHESKSQLQAALSTVNSHEIYQPFAFSLYCYFDSGTHTRWDKTTRTFSDVYFITPECDEIGKYFMFSCYSEVRNKNDILHVAVFKYSLHKFRVTVID